MQQGFKASQVVADQQSEAVSHGTPPSPEDNFGNTEAEMSDPESQARDEAKAERDRLQALEAESRARGEQ